MIEPVVPAGLYPESMLRVLLGRPDAAETITRIAGEVAGSADQEMVVTLTALAVLRAREAAERKAARR